MLSIGVAIVTKCIVGKAILAINIRSSKRCFTHPSMLARRSALVLKVGVLYVNALPVTAKQD